MDRKKFFKSGVKEVARELAKTPVGRIIDRQLHGISNLLDPVRLEAFIPKEAKTYHEIKRAYPRPPGSLPNPTAFKKACTLCRDCVVACPYGAIFMMDGEQGPVINPNENACFLCEDWPCIKACETGAMVLLEEDVLPKFGHAKLTDIHCMNHPDRVIFLKGGKKKRYCKECLKACPVEDVVIYNEQKLPEFDQYCTGCGICVKACPESAIHVVFDEHSDIVERNR